MDRFGTTNCRDGEGEPVAAAVSPQQDIHAGHFVDPPPGSTVEHVHSAFRAKPTATCCFVTGETPAQDPLSVHIHRKTQNTHTFNTPYRPGMGAGVFKLLHDAQKLMGCGCDTFVV